MTKPDVRVLVDAAQEAASAVSRISEHPDVARLQRAVDNLASAYVELVLTARAHVTVINDIASGRATEESIDEAAHASFGSLCEAIGKKSEVNEN